MSKLLVVCALALSCLCVQAWGDSPPGSGSGLPASMPNVGAQIAPSPDSKTAKDLLSDLEGLLQTLKAENATSLTASDERVQKLLLLSDQLAKQIVELQLSKADSAELKQAFSQLSAGLEQLSQMLNEMVTIDAGLKDSLTQLSKSFDDYKRSSDSDIASARTDALAARKTAQISMVAAGVGIGAAAGLAIGGPVGAAIGAGLGAILAILFHPD